MFALRVSKFVIPSFLGVLLFIVPVPFEGSYTILIGIMAQWFQNYFAAYLPGAITVFLCAVALISSIASALPGRRGGELFQECFAVSTWWVLLRCVSAVIAVLTYFKIGAVWVHGPSTGGLIVNELLPVLVSVFLFASFLLALLVDFGLLEFFGIVLSRIMRPLFKLPGRSAIDCLASWVGDGTIGILLTSKQYETGHYSAREAAIIGTTFSIVSITFSIVVISQVDLAHMFVPFYLTVILCGLACALIMPRIPPLSRKPETFYCPPPTKAAEEVDSLLAKAFAQALEQASKGSFSGFVKSGVKNLFEMWIGVLPVVVMIGTTALIIAETTPIFAWIGKPFVPLLELLQIPEASFASQAIAVGFADMFLPAILAANIDSELTRFVVACTSVSQLIFMTETGGLLLASKIPVGVVDLIVIFILRTLISLPIAALLARVFFF